MQDDNKSIEDILYHEKIHRVINPCHARSESHDLMYKKEPTLNIKHNCIKDYQLGFCGASVILLHPGSICLNFRRKPYYFISSVSSES